MKSKLSLILLLSILVSPFVYSMGWKEETDITLRSKAGVNFTVKWNIAKESGLLKDMLEDVDEEDKEERENVSIPVPNIDAQYLRIIIDLMKKASDLKDDIRLAGYIKSKKFKANQLKRLFAAANYLNAKNILNGLCVYFIDIAPTKYLGKYNPLGLVADAHIKDYQWYMEKNVEPFIIEKLKTKAFNKWFNQAKWIPDFKEKIFQVIDKIAIEKSLGTGFNEWFNRVKRTSFVAEKISEVIWKYADQKSDEEIVELFNLIEENLLKMALRLVYYKSTDSLLDIIDVSKLHIKEKRKSKVWAHFHSYTFEDVFKIKTQILPTFNVGGTGLTNYTIINRFLYLTIAKIRGNRKITLNLKHNGLRSVPDAIYLCKTYLKRTVSLQLNYNEISVFPRRLKNMSNLEILDLRDCKLDKFPVFITFLKSLKILNVAYNKLRDVKDFPVLKKGNLSTLQILKLNRNQLVNVPESFKYLENLKLLYLEWNELKKFPRFIRKLKKLESMDISHNFIKIIPDFMTKIETLKGLKVDRRIEKDNKEIIEELKESGVKFSFARELKERSSLRKPKL